MKTLILIFIVALIGCTQETRQTSLLNVSSEIWSDTIPDWDHKDATNIKIQYSGDWKHMSDSINGKTGSYPLTDQAIAKYEFTGQRIDIYTELFSHHGKYIVRMDGIDLDTINVKDNRNLRDQLTYSITDLAYNMKHVLELRRFGKTFVLNKLIRYCDYSPYPPGPEPCEPDTVYTLKVDTIYLPLDTLILVQPQIYIKFENGEITYILK